MADRSAGSKKQEATATPAALRRTVGLLARSGSEAKDA